MPDTLDLGRLEKLLAEATPGPWTCDGPSDNVIVWGAKIDTRVCFMTSDGKAAQNATLIVAAVNALPHLLSRISELESAQEWQPIETAPKDGTEFQALGRDWGDPKGRIHAPVAVWDDDKGGFVDASDPDVHLIYLTHWQSLPAAPQARNVLGEKA